MDVKALKNGGFIVTWVDQWKANGGGGVNDLELKAQIYDLKSLKNGEIFSLIKKAGYSGYESEVIALADGNLVVNRQNIISIFNSDGKQISDSFSMNTYNSGIASPTMSALKDGGFISAWETDKQDGDSRGIFAQRFDASGNTVGTEFQVNTYSKGAQQKPNIVSLSDSGFLITWQSWAQELDPQENGRKGNGIFGQRYGADNLPVGKEFQINTTTDDNQDTPNVIALTDGTVVVAWQSDNQNGAKDYDIYAQRLDTGLPQAVVDKPTTTDTPKTDGSTPTSTTSTSFEGTSKNDKLQGDDGNNTLLGLAGDDVLNGGSGDDIIKGGAGKDVLVGGADVLIGGLGVDTFKFNSLDDTGNTEETADIIVDFNTKQKDKIDLSGIDADEDKAGEQAFTLVKSFSNTDATGQLFFDVKTQMIYGSTNADSDPEFVILLNGVTSLKAADFVL